VAEEQSGGTLIYSWIVGNEVRDNGSDGILIDVSNYNIELFDNEAEGNHLDCEDDTTSGGAPPTIVDEWLNNTGTSSFPPGLCTPGRRHDH
jgi:parallel beta-helix repeat protein